MAKSKAAKKDARIRQLQTEVANLQLKAAGATKKKKKKKSKNKRKGNPFGGWALRGQYARAVLDPFSAKGARVPDSFLLKTATGISRATTFVGSPKFNFTNNTAYCMVTFAPMDWSGSTMPLAVFNSTSPTNTVWDLTANAVAAWDFSKSCYAGYTHHRDNITPHTARRIVGGGVRVSFRGVQPNTMVEVHMVPRFNGDAHISNWVEAVTRSTRTYRFDKPDDVVFPIPIRNSAEAYNWVPAASDGTAIDHYPAGDYKWTTATIRNAMTSAYADANTANASVRSWSMQSGMGGMQIFFTVPPGSSFEVEYILHSELMPDSQNVTGNDTALDFVPSSTDEIETVCNAASCLTNADSGVNLEGAETPWKELVNLASRGAAQVGQGAVEAALDSRMLQQITRQALNGMFAPRGLRRIRRLE